MVALILKDELLIDELTVALKDSTGDLLRRDFRAIASEYLDEDRAKEQIELFISEINKSSKYDCKEKKLLEIGAGVGTFLVTVRKKYAINAVGIEPSEDEFSPFNKVSKALFRQNDISEDLIFKAAAENLPFENNTFDLIYSTNVLEHVKDPKKVLSEAIRVLKPGGFLQFVIPNYFSFWEGHYGILWPCITNRFLAKIYAVITGNNPAYIDTLQLISPMYLKKILKPVESQIEVLGWGKDIFKKRLTTGNYTDWASLRNIRWIVALVQKLKISNLIADILNIFQMHTPIVLTLRKKP